MAKSIKIKCTSSRAVNIHENNLYSARVDDEGNVSMMVYNSAEMKKKRVILSVGVSGELFIAGAGGPVVATFIELKTKTLKCVGLDHGNPMKNPSASASATRWKAVVRSVRLLDTSSTVTDAAGRFTARRSASAYRTERRSKQNTCKGFGAVRPDNPSAFFKRV